MLKYTVVLILLFLVTNVNANNRDKIIENLKNIKNLDFNFEQNINGKIENGNCTIEYPKKIFCEYARSNNKILVSNGKSLVIKTLTSYYRYPLKKTPLNFILDKEFLINKINRVWVHTCTLDHKNALNNYMTRGMKIFKTEIVNI